MANSLGCKPNVFDCEGSIPSPTTMNKKRLCRECGIERPLSDFIKKSNGFYSKVCSRPHEPEDVVRVKRHKLEQRIRAREAKNARSMAEQADYERARQRAPRRVTQLKTSRLPLGVPTGMTPNDYAIYLTSPHWIQFRDEFRAKYDFTCFICSSSGEDLHHITYSRLGAEGTNDVIPLCRECHTRVHEAIASGVKLDNAHIYIRGLDISD